MSIHSDLRDQISAGLRGLRTDRGLSTYQLTDLLGEGWNQSKVTRRDSGKTLATPDEVEAWTRALHAPSDVREHLVNLARQAETELTAWRRENATGRRQLQQRIGEIEQGVHVVRYFAHDVVPGPAQTRDYAKVTFLLDQDEPLRGEDVDAIVEARIARQQALTDTTKQFRMLTTETAFVDALLDPAGMLEQVDKVLEVAALPNVEFGMIPFRRRNPDGTVTRRRTQTYHAFAVLGDLDVDDDAIVLAETVTDGLTIRGRDKIQRYITHYDQLARDAITGDQLARYLREVAARHPWS